MTRQRDRRAPVPIIPIIFLFLSAAYVLLAIFVKKATGPYWLNPNLDPAYVYLISGLQILVGELPGQYEHPGTPLQIIIAALISLLNISKNYEDTVIAVLQDPEYYLNAVWIALVSLYACSQLIVSSYAYRLTRDLAFSLCMFLPGFILLSFKSWSGEGASLTIAANISPEHLFMTLGNLYVMGVLYFLTRQEGGHDREIVYWGILCGLSLMTKLTFGPLLLLPLAFWKSWRERGLFVGACMVTALISTIPLFPIYGSVFGWFFKLGGHSGFYGSGPKGFINPSTYIPNLALLIRENIFLLILLGISAYFFLRGRANASSSEPISVTRKHWACVVMMLSAFFLLVPKMPSSHYLVPAYSFSGLLLGLVYWQWRAFDKRRIFAVLIVVMIVGFSIKSVLYSRDLGSKTSRLQAFSQRILREHPACLIIPFYRSSSLTHALFFGNSWYYRNTFSAYLEKLYPESYFYDKWRGHISNFTEVIPVAELSKRYPCLMLVGSHEEDWEYEMLKVDEEEGERLYRVNAPD